MFNFEKNLNIYINVKILQNPVSKISHENLKAAFCIVKITVFLKRE